jgi:multiple sugar transport system permease protein
MSKSVVVIPTKAKTQKRNLAGKLGITLVTGGKVQGSDLVMALVMFLPAFVVLVFLGTYPIITALISAFQRRAMFDPTDVSWVGFDNFISVFQHPQLWKSFSNDIVFTLSAITIQAILGIAVALLLQQTFPGRNILRGLVLFSYVFPVAVAAIIWRFMLSDSVGIIHHLIDFWELPIPNTWFSSPKTAMPSVIMVTGWKYFPFMVITFLARLQTIDVTLYEAAKVDGANALQRFWYITLPMLMPVIVIVLLLRTIWTFNNWEIVALLTQGGPSYSTITPPILVYNTLFKEFSLGRAAAISVLMTGVLLVAMVFYLRAYYRSEESLS